MRSRARYITNTELSRASHDMNIGYLMMILGLVLCFLITEPVVEIFNFGCYFIHF